MAWNKYYIIIANQPGIPAPDVVDRLCLEGWNPSGSATFPETNKSDDLFVGHFQDALVIANPELTYELFTEEPSDFQQRLISVFPASLIAAFMDNETVGEFGFAIIENGQRIRRKHGCDGEIYGDSGKPLPEEQAIRSASIFEPEELDEMRETMDEAEVQAMIECEAGYRASVEIAKRFLGDRIDNLDDDAIRLTRFKKA